ncbi:amino acid adenylation domain-containing protein [Streptomyces sp. NPDC093982]|uniref:amino acid adenylation domain-containing protein n=1 Tax=Streptomyces sp. NPDC093982 TaxID=3155077 RepID=UPI0034132727
MNLHSLVTASASRAPSDLAVSGPDGKVTYGELDRAADRIAASLIERGVGGTDRVLIWLDKSVAAVAVMQALLRLSAVYVPVDPANPLRRTALIAGSCSAKLIVTNSSRACVLRASGLDLPPLYVIDRLPPDSGRPAPVAEHTEADDLAYILYTSGSTGEPKGVCITHRNALSFVQWAATELGATSGDRFANHAPFSFDISVLDLYVAFLAGASVHLIPADMAYSPRQLSDFIVTERITVWYSVPSVLIMMISDGGLCDAPRPSALRSVLFAGEPFAVDALAQLFRHWDGVRFLNLYGPTETNVCTFHEVTPQDICSGRPPPIGRACSGDDVYAVRKDGQRAREQEEGELVVTGPTVMAGYWGLQTQREPYRTGDLVRVRADGAFEFLGRLDQMVKVSGHRIELGEIEANLVRHPTVSRAAVIVRGTDAEGRLVAYVVAAASQRPTAAILRSYLSDVLPAHMLPSAYVLIDSLPLNVNGKLDRRALPDPPSTRPDLFQPYEEPRTARELGICDAFARVLGLDRVGRKDSFFDLGGNSMLAVRLARDLPHDTGDPVTPTVVFRHPTPEGLAAARGEAGGLHSDGTSELVVSQRPEAEPVALVAMAGRFPGASDVEAFWDNLVTGRESITFFDESALDARIGTGLRSDPSYVRARGILDGVEDFDPAFFGINPREAQLMDPQQRLFLELSWQCLERGGYVPDATPGPVGVYGGMHNATYYQRHVLSRPDLVERAGEFQVMLANEKDYLASRVAHRLNLTGPAVSVNTACSTSLVAVALAFDALRRGACRMALAGGVAITCPPRSGYLHAEGAMLSPDGHTRTFDAGAAGTVFSDGAAVVLLKRLSDALTDGDTVYAVITGAALNNDGGGKASFTAPSVDGQAAVIIDALTMAGVGARDISYVEAHGTATPLGDPIEIEGLTKAFAQHTADTGFCAVGSVKSNVGHLVTAAGVAGLIKTALALHHEVLPPSINYRAANPAIDFDATPFHVNSELSPWTRESKPRRSGVSSFGVGGTNAHVIVEEAPPSELSEPASGPQLLTVSARTPTALAKAEAQLADHLDHQRDVNLADVAHTLRVGRKGFTHRTCLVADTVADAVAGLREEAGAARAIGSPGARAPQPLFLFAGQGAQYPGMGHALYDGDPGFRVELNHCFEAFDRELDFDLRDRMFASQPASMEPTSVTQPAMFAIGYALARRLMALGVAPAALIGHSVGEFVSAVIADVMRLEDAARLVALRGAMIQATPTGAMLSVRLPAAELVSLLPEGVSLAADNAQNSCVAAGPKQALEELCTDLTARGIATHPLHTSHAFHSAMLDDVVAPFEELVRATPLSAPTIPIYSTVSGDALTAEGATDPRYWARHLRQTVRFSPAVRTALKELGQPLFIELGPRGTLATLARQHSTPAQPATSVALLADQPATEHATWLLGLGQLWTQGLELDTVSLDGRTHKRRVPLPTYPFERQRCWVEMAPITPPAAPTPSCDTVPESTLTTAPSSTTAPPRRPALLLQLRDLFGELSGLDMSQVASNAPFVDIGLDSLTLTQIALQLKKHFRVDISFRQLIEEYNNLDAFADFLATVLPAPDPVTDSASPTPTSALAPPTIAPPAFAATDTLASGLPSPPQMVLSTLAPPAQPGHTIETTVHEAVLRQIELMHTQLALLAAGSTTTATAPPTDITQTAPAVENTPAPSAAAGPEKNDGPPAASMATTPAYDARKAFGAITRIHTERDKVGDDQREVLADFIRDYTSHTRKSKEFTQAHRGQMADPRVVSGFRPATKEITYQVVVERSKGSKVWDIDGNVYVDVLNGFGANLFGWQPAFINEAVHRQLDLGYEIGPQHPLAAAVTATLCELTGAERAALCNTGSEAVMAALRIARTVTGRTTVVLFAGSYHGTFDEVLVRPGPNGRGVPAVPGVLQGNTGDVRVLKYGAPESLEFIRTHARKLAAVLVEPVQSRHPDHQPREFLRQVQEITDQSGTCLIFDEVITGFRSDLGGAQALFGVRADLACYGKVIGGGFPIGVVAGKRSYMDALDGGMWRYGDDSTPTVGVTYFAGTFVRHPLALAASSAVLDHLKRDDNHLQPELNARTAAMAATMNSFCHQIGAPLKIQQFSSLWRVAWREDHPLQGLLFPMMRSRSVHILENFPCFLTTAHSEQDIEIVISAFKESVRHLQQGGLLSPNQPGTTTGGC